MKKQRQIFASFLLLFAFSIHAVLPLISHSLNTADYTTVVFEEIDQDGTAEEGSDFSSITIYLSEYKFSELCFSRKGLLYDKLEDFRFVKEVPPYIYFHNLKLAC